MGLLISSFRCWRSEMLLNASVSSPCEELLGFGWGLNHPEGFVLVSKLALLF